MTDGKRGCPFMFQLKNEFFCIYTFLERSSALSHFRSSYNNYCNITFLIMLHLYSESNGEKD